MERQPNRWIIVALAAMGVVIVALSVGLAFLLGRQSAPSQSAASPTTTLPTETSRPSQTAKSTTPSEKSTQRRDEVADLVDSAARQFCRLPMSTSLVFPDPALANGCYMGFNSGAGTNILGPIFDYWSQGSPLSKAEVQAYREQEWQQLTASLGLRLKRAEFDRGFAAGIAWVNEQWAQTPWPRGS